MRKRSDNCHRVGGGIQITSIENPPPPDVFIVNFQRSEYRRTGRPSLTYPLDGLAIGESVYTLGAMVIHEGPDRNSEHYQCLVRINGHHFKCNDAITHEINRSMLTRNAMYILVYEKA